MILPIVSGCHIEGDSEAWAVMGEAGAVAGAVPYLSPEDLEPKRLPRK
jgi:hypothetical protein